MVLTIVNLKRNEGKMKKKLNIRSIILIATIIIASMLFINICFAVNTGKVNVEAVKLRDKPEDDAIALELVFLDEDVEILKEYDEIWYQVKYKDIIGYIKKDLIDTNENSENNKTVDNNTLEESQEKSSDKNEEQKENETAESNIEGQEKVYKIKENTKLKITPLIMSLDLEEIAEGEQVEIIETIGDWLNIKTSKHKKGWIRQEKVVSEIKETKQDNENQNNNQEENRQNENKQEENKKEERQTSTKQETSRSATNTRTTIEEKNNTSSSTSSNSKNYTQSPVTSVTGNSVVAYAKQFLGCKYVYGGTTTNGFDCSGFTQFVYKHFGINLNRTAQGQYSNGTAVTSLQAGDLVMFGKSGINHVGIYIGGNTFIHAANTSRGVTTDTLASGYYKTNYVGARRVLK